MKVFIDTKIAPTLFYFLKEGPKTIYIIEYLQLFIIQNLVIQYFYVEIFFKYRKIIYFYSIQ